MNPPPWYALPCTNLTDRAMKQLTCAQLGGPASCTFMVSGTTPDEVIDAGWKHIEAMHPELAESIKSNPKEVNDQWMADFRNRFPDLPEIS